jgi:hypothetical protein
MKALKIISCYDSRKWYADKIGQLVPYIEKGSTSYEYKSLQDDGCAPGHRYSNFVARADAVIVEIDEKELDFKI